MELLGQSFALTFDIILFVVFILAMTIGLYVKRKKLALQKLLYPFFYIIMYRTKWGLKLMDTIASKYRGWVQLYGYIGVGVGFIGMAYISLGVLFFLGKLILVPGADATGVSLVLPFTNIPGIGYLSFTHWIISIFVLAAIHEFSHGVVARAHNVPVKSSGFAVFAVLLPVIPAAFVEPDEKKLSKKHDIVQYSVFAAGPMANLVLAFLIVMIFPFVGDMTNSTLAPYEDKFTYPAGFSYEILEGEDYPAFAAGVPNGILTSINDVGVEDYTDFYQAATCLIPGDEVILGTDQGKYSFATVAHPDRPGKGFIGMKPTQNERRVYEEHTGLASVYYWFRGLLKWLFLLNLFIGLANLLPLGIVDGGRMLQTALHSLYPNNKGRARKLWGFISMLFLFALGFALFVNYFGNPLALLFG
jgi:membrane-associated protease RseP (regulator of RpoE activity)